MTTDDGRHTAKRRKGGFLTSENRKQVVRNHRSARESRLEESTFLERIIPRGGRAMLCFAACFLVRYPAICNEGKCPNYEEAPFHVASVMIVVKRVTRTPSDPMAISKAFAGTTWWSHGDMKCRHS